MPKVSVIIPVYNTERYLRRCLDSVCNQTLSDIEIICVNDCSPDNSLDILNEYATKDSRIKIIDFKENKGAAVARNKGISEASGEYIGFVDSDDFVDLDFYEKLYTKALETDADCVKGNIKTYNNVTQISKTEQWLNLNDLIKKNKAYFYFTFTSAIYSAKVIKSNNIKFLEGFVHFEDPYFTIFANLYYDKICVLDDIYYYYCDNKESSSRKQITNKHVESQIKGSKLILELLSKHNVKKQHYIIVVGFVIRQLFDWAYRFDISDNITSIATDGIDEILKNCQYSKECLKEYFMILKNEYRKNAIQKIRENLLTKNKGITCQKSQ